MWQIVDMMLAERARRMAEEAERERLVAAARGPRRRRRKRLDAERASNRAPDRAAGYGSATTVQETP